MRSVFPLFVALALAACGSKDNGNAMANAAIADGPMPAGAPPLPKGPPASACPMPNLDLVGAKLDPVRASRFTANFKAALEQACTEGYFLNRTLIDPGARDQQTLFVVDNPEGNVPIIYLSREAQPPRMQFEVPFQADSVPSREDIHEALFCAFRGASEEEINTTGRCLVD